VIYVEWMICILYMIAAALAWRCAKMRRTLAPRQDRAVQFWTFVGIALFVFGVNKIADLQSYLLEGLKALALETHLRVYRDPLKILFLTIVGAIAFPALVTLSRRARESTTQPRWLVGGAVCLIGYYLLRAGGSVSDSLRFIGPSRLWPLEAIGILLIIAASVRNFNSMRKHLGTAE